MKIDLDKYQPAFKRMADKHTMLNTVMSMITHPNSSIHGLIIEGSPGVGKSYAVESFLKKNEIKHTVIKGGCSPSGLFGELLRHRHRGHVTVLDDTDNVLDNEDGLNILKAATDTMPSRRISRTLSKRIVPLVGLDSSGSFEFEGSLIVITNHKMAEVKSKKLKPHVEAILSRTRHVVMDDGSRNSAFVQIVYAVRHYGILDAFNLDENVVLEMLGYMEDNRELLKDCNLRTVIKLAEIVKQEPENWRVLADYTMINPYEGE